MQIHLDQPVVAVFALTRTKDWASIVSVEPDSRISHIALQHRDKRALFKELESA